MQYLRYRFMKSYLLHKFALLEVRQYRYLILMGKIFKYIKQVYRLGFRTFRRGIYDLKVWPDVLPDVKINSSTPGKIEPVSNKEQILSNHTNQTIKSISSSPVITTTNLQFNRKLVTSKPLNITWNEDSAYPMLDELGRIAKVK